MKKTVFRPCFAALLAAGLLLSASAGAQQPTAFRAAKVKPYPAGTGFDKAGSDAKAQALADRVMAQMGGYEAWQSAHFIGWNFFGDQYQVWDKYTGDFHWQKGDLVANYNLNTKVGHAYKAGQDISTTEEGKKLLDKMYPVWVNNSWWLVMPFKLKDSGVTLTSKGAGKLMDGTAAEVLNMTFKNVGVTPDNKYELLVNPKTNLIEEWAYFPKATDAQPAFRRRWSEYKPYGPILLAADRTDGKDGRRLDHLAVVNSVPAGLMQSPTPVEKL
ncbi:hypothetical protein [Hymenobacter persicinus]|uniref:DUF3078 domain-containing protein n=1 Tax=Hymenobacter persicinus TaxID=2025506 RepID=A0A4Q5L994_9BACT|nr:hypothetical protein [Hymenobacter persicinus]RYU78319.1 hypothetical protein EWM57_14185 [Hymenobacter persicinus]